MPSPKLSIIIPTSGNNPLLKDCLDSLKKQDLKPNQYQILTITNQDLSQTGKSFSFSAAVNLAARQASADHLLITNDDIIFKKNSLSELLQTLKHYPQALVGAAIWDKSTKNPAPAGYKINLWTGVIKPLYGQKDLASSDWISGCALVISKTIWKKLKGLDEIFSPGFFEDADLCFRAKNKGYKLIFSPTFEVIHAQTASFNRNLKTKYEAWYRNKILFSRLHATPLQLVSSLFFQYALITPARAVFLHDGRFLPAIKGLLWNLMDFLKSEP